MRRGVVKKLPLPGFEPGFSEPQSEQPYTSCAILPQLPPHPHPRSPSPSAVQLWKGAWAYQQLDVQMSSAECRLELFLFPILFQTVSFHHRATYELRFSLTPTPSRILPVRQLFAGEQRELIDRNGNAWNVDGYSPSPTHFRTNKFPIEYNDQIVKFKTGCLARLPIDHQHPLTLTVAVELLKTPEDAPKTKGKRVSAETLEVNLRGGEGGNLRRLVFSTNEYISFVDLAFQFVRLRPAAAAAAPQGPLQLYEELVLGRLEIYEEVAQRTTRKMEEFELVKRSHPSFRHAYSISAAFEARFTDHPLPSLAHVALPIQLPPQLPIDLAESDFSIQRREPEDLVALLCNHFECEPHELEAFIRDAGDLIESNIRAVFERLIQLTICLQGEDQHFITAHEIARVKAIIAQTETHSAKQHTSTLLSFPQEAVNAHRAKIANFLRSFSSLTGAEQRQPYVEVTNDIPKIENPLSSSFGASAEGTLTVFIHGYKGNEYDLTKVKSHLMLLLGCGNFYSIKGLSNEKAAEATIRVLGETAARELKTYLELSPAYRTINLIGFSLGGVIARAMLPWLEAHRSKLNLLLTIATPHLGIRDVQNCLVRAGLCYMRRVAGIESIRELNSERNETHSRYLMELAQGEGLEWFRSIILVGSFEDSYVPAYSALVGYAGEDEVTAEMGRRLSKSMQRAVRVAVRLQYSENLLDVITRRRTHISFLEDDGFIKYLLVRFQHLFAHRPLPHP